MGRRGTTTDDVERESIRKLAQSVVATVNETPEDWTERERRALRSMVAAELLKLNGEDPDDVDVRLLDASGELWDTLLTVAFDLDALAAIDEAENEPAFVYSKQRQARGAQELACEILKKYAEDCRRELPAVWKG